MAGTMRAVWMDNEAIRINPMGKAKRRGAEGNGDGVAVLDPVPVPVDVSNHQAEAATVAIELIDASPYQTRKDFDEAELQDLAATMRAHGLLQPLVVRRKGDRYELIAGERRLRAAKLAGLQEVPVQIRSADNDQAAELTAIENLQRKDLNAIEEARAYQLLLNRTGCTQQDLADRLGKSQPHIANRLRLLGLPDEWQGRVISGEMPATHARALLPVKDHPKILQEVGRHVKAWLKEEDGLGTVEDFRENLFSIVRHQARELGEKYWAYNSEIHDYIPTFTPTEAERKQLGVICLEGRNGDKPVELATNTKLFDKIQKAFAADYVAKKKAKADTKKDDKKASAKPTKQELAKRAEEQERQYRRRLWRWYIDWQRYLVAKAILDGIQTTRGDLERILFYFAVALGVTTPSFGGAHQRQDLLGGLMRALDLKFNAADPLGSILAIEPEGGDGLLKVLGQFLAASLFHGEDGPVVPMPDGHVRQLADYLAINSLRSWEAEQGGEFLTEDYWSLHTKDQLAALAKELRVEVDSAGPKAAMVEALHKPGIVKGFPKELAKIKQPKG
jgi:ParB family chromosome partitioning protein